MMARLDAACEAIGRDPATLTRSVMAGTLVGHDERDMARRTEAQGTGHLRGCHGRGGLLAAGASRSTPYPGTPEAARARIAEYAETGVDRLLFQLFLPRDLEHVALIAELAGL